MSLSRKQKLGAGGVLVVIAAAAVGLSLGDDGGSSDGDGGTTTTTAPPIIPGGERPTALPDGEEIPPGTIIALDLQFGPGTVRVTAGETVTLRNEDSVDHTFTADDGLFDSGTLHTGEEATFSFDGPREVGIHCEIHPSMTATLVVDE